jgi:hypothetical protein
MRNYDDTISKLFSNFNLICIRIMIFLSNLDEKCFLLLRFLTKIRNPERVRQNWQGPNENHGFVKEKFRELGSDQIEGAE